MNKIFISILLLLSFSLNAQITDEGDPCAPGGHWALSNLGIVTASSTSSTTTNWQNIINGDYTEDAISSSTEFETNAWVEVNLQQEYTLNNISIYYRQENYPEGMSDFYILVSSMPFASNDLSTNLSSSAVQYLHVTQSMPSGLSIPLNNILGQYVRIQKSGPGIIGGTEITIGGGDPEVDEDCDNGIDDDCDGLVDCDDPDCQTFPGAITSLNPTCNICYDGEIIIRLTMVIEPITYSINGGPFQNIGYSNGLIKLTELLPGNYHIVVRNGNGCEFEINVVLVEPEGEPEECCENGGLESGNFDGWSGGIGRVADNGTVIIANNLLAEQRGDINDRQHAIISTTTNYTDPNAPELSIINANTGTYVVRLGNNIAKNGADRLTYCFDVTECNKNFLFNYLLVMFDPSHDPASGDFNPYFQFSFSDLTTGEMEFKTKTIVADKDSDFFTTRQLPQFLDPVIYSNWTCESTDLSDRIGHEVCIEFLTVDCTEGGHLAYSYIDGLCSTVEDVSPSVNIQVNDIICANQEPIVDMTGSGGYDQFGFTICNTTTGDCAGRDFAPGIIEPVNVETLFSDMGISLECGHQYNIELTLGNACVPNVSGFAAFEISCNNGPELNYPDIYECYIDETANVQLIGTVDNCNGCVFQWSPASFLDNATLQNPTALGSQNVLALYQTYTVVATDENGCEETDDVKIYDMSDHHVVTNFIEHLCSHELKANIIFSPDIVGANVILKDVMFSASGTGIQIPGIISNENDGVFEISSGEIDKLDFMDGYWQITYTIVTERGEECEYFEEFGFLTGSDQFFGGFRIAIENIFSPNGDGVDDEWGVLIPYSGSSYNYGTEHNAISMRIEVFNRFGDRVFDTNDTKLFPNGGPESSPDMPFNTADFTWDGTHNGILQETEAYKYVVHVSNCEFPGGIRCGSGNHDTCTSGVPPSTWCECNRYEGWLTLCGPDLCD